MTRTTQAFWRALALCTAAIATVLPLAGCQLLAGPQMQASEVTVRMPDVAMTDLDEAGQDLEKQGLSVVVVRPAFSVVSGPETTKPGSSFQVEEYVRPFEPDAWDHWVTMQMPDAGTELPRSATVTLTAGQHLGASPGKTWLDAHGEAVDKQTDKECMKSCHDDKHCTECHDRAGVKDEKAPKK